MILQTEIKIYDTEFNCIVNYDYYKENREIIINLNSIICRDVDIQEVLLPAELENIKDDCQIHYENHKFREIESLMDKTWYGLDNFKEEL